jgi:hypothetical protein
MLKGLIDLIECGPYTTGANSSGFKEFVPDIVDLGFGIAEIQLDGTLFVTKPENSNGVVNKFNITSQLLYELQREIYLNPDVAADISNIRIENTARPNVVFVSGILGLLPPETTKAMIAAAKGGYQCETTFYINDGANSEQGGLILLFLVEYDVAEKLT